MRLTIQTLTVTLLLLVSFSLFAAEEAPMTIDGATTVDVTKAKELFDQGAVFVDPRRTSEYDAGRIPDAISLELKSAFNQAALAEIVKPDAPVVFYCNGPKCPRSAKCSEMAVSWGYKKVYYFRDGIPAWQAAGYPIE
jgi:rhodanese-related sulfurtransferase